MGVVVLLGYLEKNLSMYSASMMGNDSSSYHAAVIKHTSVVRIKNISLTLCHLKNRKTKSQTCQLSLCALFLFSPSKLPCTMESVKTAGWNQQGQGHASSLSIPRLVPPALRHMHRGPVTCKKGPAFLRVQLHHC